MTEQRPGGAQQKQAWVNINHPTNYPNIANAHVST